MVRQKGVSLPSGQGGLVGGFNSSYKTKIQIDPKTIIYLSLGVVVLIWLLFNIAK